NMLIFAFADTTTSAINQDYLIQIQTAINSEAAGTINLLSIGGANNSNISDSTDVSTLVSNIVTQINTYNQQLQGGKISGVDLDLEGSFSP
uniref:glycosyl hydrolase family 18 protein n=1 Tax=Vibrio cholerae TaxID=666 RepID=UPI0018F0F2A8